MKYWLLGYRLDCARQGSTADHLLGSDYGQLHPQMINWQLFRAAQTSAGTAIVACYASGRSRRRQILIRSGTTLSLLTSAASSPEFSSGL